jgi:hypothetical protein
MPSATLSDLLSTAFVCIDSVQTVVFVDPDATTEEQGAILAVLSRDGRQPITATSEQVRDRLLGRYAEDPAALAVIEASEIPAGIVVASPDPDADLALRGEVSDLPGVQQTVGTDCRDHTSGERPTTVALVREDGWLVTVDLATGEERELHFVGDPEAPPSGQEEGGPQFIDSVEISPDGEWVYFSTCCEPAAGTTFRIPIGGGEPEQVSLGAYPRISPDGRFLATSHCLGIDVAPIDDPSAGRLHEVDGCVSRLAWSPDGTQLAAVEGVGSTDAAPEVLLFDWDGAALTPADPGKPENPGQFVAWSPEGVSVTISGGGSVDSSRSLAQDDSYRWLIWVDSEGVVREQAGVESGELPAIAGLPEALAADW